VPPLADAVARAAWRRLVGLVQGPSRPSLVLAVNTPPEHPGAAAQVAAALRAVGASVGLIDTAARPEEVAETIARRVAELRRQHRIVVLSLPHGSPAVAERMRGQAHREISWIAAPPGLRAHVAPLHAGEREAPLQLFVPAAELSAQGPALRQLARRMLGASIGVALSAGNVRGVAHLGVLRAFARAGLEIDALAGCSMGSVIGGLIAAGYSIEDVLALLHSAGLHRLAAPSFFGKPAWMAAREALLEGCAGLTFETAALPFLCNATDLETGAMAVFESGPLGPAMCASMATPPLFPPYHHEGRVYLDGAFINGLPANLLAERGLHLVVAVDVLHRSGPWKAPPAPSGGFASKLLSNLPWTMRLAAVLRVLERSLHLSLRELVETRFTSSDLTIRPKIEAAPLDWNPARFGDMADAGERAAEPAVRELLQRQRALLARWS
jgi:NTE family protein